MSVPQIFRCLPCYYSEHYQYSFLWKSEDPILLHRIRFTSCCPIVTLLVIFQILRSFYSPNLVTILNSPSGNFTATTLCPWNAELHSPLLPDQPSQLLSMIPVFYIHPVIQSIRCHILWELTHFNLYSSRISSFLTIYPVYCRSRDQYTPAGIKRLD